LAAYLEDPLLAARRHAEAITVGEYATRLGRALRAVGSAVIEGEVQKVSRTQRGMIYFELTDGEALLTCKAFGRDAARFEHQPQPGDLVQVQVDRPDFYLARGSVSLIVSAVRLAGEGELLRRRAELLARLTAEGLCEPGRRHPLPRFPRAVGVIAGQGSDGMSDVVRALTDRWPAVRIITCVSLVQGKAAPAQLIDALARLQDHALVDVIVMARGGGSVQDLACFDDEGLCRALFACEVPVVCAIGHTDNNPVCNHVAWHAFTPSRSAELVVTSAVEMRHDVAAAGDRLGRVSQQLELASERVAVCAQHVNCKAVLDDRAQRLRTCADALARTSDRLLAVAREVGELATRVGESTRRQLAEHTRDYGRAIARLTTEARSGLDRREARVRELVARDAQALTERVRRRLDDTRRDATHQAAIISASDFRSRGWLLASTDDGTPARAAADLSIGQPLCLHLHDGHAHVIVAQAHREHGSSDP
jgi:exodeoxyribonuclease VII large subunit